MSFFILQDNTTTLIQFHFQGNYSYNPLYRCHLQRRAGAVTLISPYLLFLKTPFTADEAPRGPSCYQVRYSVLILVVISKVTNSPQYLSYGCKPIFVNGVLDKAALKFESVLYDEVFSLACRSHGSDSEKTWEETRMNLNGAFLDALNTEPPTRGKVNRPVVSSPANVASETALIRESPMPAIQPPSAGHINTDDPRSHSAPAKVPSVDESHALKSLTLDDVMNPDILDNTAFLHNELVDNIVSNSQHDAMDIDICTPPISTVERWRANYMIKVLPDALQRRKSPPAQLTVNMHDITPQCRSEVDEDAEMELAVSTPVESEMELAVSTPVESETEAGAHSSTHAHLANDAPLFHQSPPAANEAGEDIIDGDVQSSDEHEGESSGSEFAPPQSRQQAATRDNAPVEHVPPTIDVPHATTHTSIIDDGSDLSSEDEPALPVRRQISRGSGKQTRHENSQ
jgi:hypothetical protein